MIRGLDDVPDWVYDATVGLPEGVTYEIEDGEVLYLDEATGEILEAISGPEPHNYAFR